MSRNVGCHGFETDAQPEQSRQFVLPRIALRYICPKRPVLRHQVNANIDVAIRPGSPLRPAPKQPYLSDSAGARGPLPDQLNAVCGKVHGWLHLILHVVLVVPVIGIGRARSPCEETSSMRWLFGRLVCNPASA